LKSLWKTFTCLPARLIDDPPLQVKHSALFSVPCDNFGQV
jgi:hypothetical protein